MDVDYFKSNFRRPFMKDQRTWRLWKIHTFDEIQTLIQCINDIVTAIEGYDAKSNVRQQMRISINLI